ncbi:MAG: acetolactate synthase [Candidatus Harrisonbacteria bacterium CG10_big_fil_rev_8_21_14_0_10_45_28]|uniref:Acetolactate synthase n=1 Tax=Candidatus Harrisonbacteria bacterium CG10_big_fil_rev_8_21_14_0_10_45_28 TaxID=1974586 RepID=A0A2H0UMS0_9BACT|nr:MAG: acetolactate synthase [Candidatus Harrisonbacteria bacterium CG10_big_fil_rev_8_21_14_0_10_45_28]
MEKVRLADYLVSFLEKEGVGDIFMISGGGNMHLVDAVGRAKTLKYVTNHHEQACAIAAESYSRIVKNLGVCLVTTGPAGTNAITGVLGGWLDSIPMLCISGQEARERLITGTKLRQLGVQEINIIDIIKPMTKYAVLVDDPSMIRYYLEKAVYLAKSGRPGPSWLDVPLDVQSALIDPGALDGFSPEAEDLAVYKNLELKNLVLKSLDMLKAAKRPVILAGHGIRAAYVRDKFLKIVDQLGIPVTTSISAPDLISSGHPLFVGRPGGFGNRPGNFAIQNSDLIIVLGSRLHFWITGYRSLDFGKNAKKIMVDIDEAELSKKSINIDLPIQADLKDFFTELESQLTQISLPDFNAWRRRCQDWKTRYPVNLPEYREEKDFVNYYYFIDELSKKLPEGQIIIAGDGTTFTATYQAVRIKNGQQLYFSVGSAALGWGLPAGIGAAFANKGTDTVLLDGDGSIMFNLQELQTVYHYNLPLKIFLINNQGYLAIRNTQNNYFNGYLVASGPTSNVTFPDFAEVANAFKIKHIRISNNLEVSAKIDEVLKTEGPIICEIMMNPAQPLNPRPKAVMEEDGTFENRPIEDMFPFLDREEYAKNMSVDPKDW